MFILPKYQYSTREESIREDFAVTTCTDKTSRVDLDKEALMSVEKMKIKLEKRKGRKSYEIRIYKGDRKLGYQWINTHESNEREANKVFKQYRNALIEYQLGLTKSIIPKRVPTLYEAVSLFIQKRNNNPDISSRTIELNKLVLYKFVDIFGKTATIESFGVDESDIYDEWLKTTIRKSGAYKGEVGLSESAQNIRKRIVTTFFNWCILDRKWIEKTDFKLKQSSPPKVIKLITPIQFQRLLDCEDNEYLRSYYKLAWNCGLRRKEINPTELFEDPNMGWCLLVPETKGRSTVERSVPIPENNIVDWYNIKEKMYSLGHITHQFRKACKKADVYEPYITTFHTLRHSYATLKCVEGMHLMELAQYLGHTTTKTTEKYAQAKSGYYAMLRKEKQDGIFVN